MVLSNELDLKVEELEERIAPSANGQLGYEGQPGNQGNGRQGSEGHNVARRCRRRR